MKGEEYICLGVVVVVNLRKDLFNLKKDSQKARNCVEALDLHTHDAEIKHSSGNNSTKQPIQQVYSLSPALGAASGRKAVFQILHHFSLSEATCACATYHSVSSAVTEKSSESKHSLISEHSNSVLEKAIAGQLNGNHQLTLYQQQQP